MDLHHALNAMRYTIIYILVYAINTMYAEDEVSSALAIVEGSAFPAPIAVTAQTFVDLITQGNIFIDKTQMIREIFQTESPLIMFARPSGWGKSINLNMVKVFSEIQVDCETQEIIPNHQTSTYRLFEHGEITMKDGTTKKLQDQLLISKNRLIMLQHQGQYIVVHMNLGGLKAKTLADLKKGIAARARLAFKAYNYDRIAISLGVDTHLMDEMARSIRTEKSNWTSFSEVCGLLKKFYKREMILLVEDYDDPFIELFGDSIANPRNSAKEFLDFYDLFFDKIMEIKFLKKVIVTGRTLLLVHKMMFSCAADDLFGKPLHLYHGFNDKEMDMMFDHLNIPPSLREQVTEHYSGYQLNMREVNVYNPLSVVKFLASNKIENYWTPKRSMKAVFNKILQIPIFRYGLLSFDVFSLEKKKTPYDTNLVLNKQYLLKSKTEVLVRFFENPQEIINRENGSNIFLYYYKNAALESGQYLLRSFGYLTRCYDIPNKEVETTIKNELISFYASSLKFKGKDLLSNSSFHVLCERLKEFLLSNETLSDELTEAFSNFLNDLEGFNSSVYLANMDQRNRDVQKIYLVSDVWNLIALYLKDFRVVECVTALRARFPEGYMVFRHGNRGIIILMVGRDLSDEETRFLSNELVKFLLPFTPTELEKGVVKQICIHYQLNGNLTIAAKVTPSAVFSQMFKSASAPKKKNK